MQINRKKKYLLTMVNMQKMKLKMRFPMTSNMTLKKKPTRFNVMKSTISPKLMPMKAGVSSAENRVNSFAVKTVLRPST